MTLCLNKMKELFILIFLLSLSYSVRSQNCYCPTDELGVVNPTGEAVKIFLFSNNIKLGLCGYVEVEKRDTIYSEFNLFECGQKKPIEEWDATESCKIKKIKDTLLIQDLYLLPVGNDFNLIWVPFYIHKFCFKKSVLYEVKYFRKDIKKYSKTQIKKVFEEYKKLSKGNYEHTLEVASMLFWAYVSGSKEAESYLKEVQKKFGPFDGAIAEEWDDVWATYKHWKRVNKT